MARFSGKAGSVNLGGAIAGITKWDVDAKADAPEVSGMDSAGVKEFIAGLTEWSGSFEGYCTGSPAAFKPGTTFTTFTLASSGTTGAPKFTADATAPAGALIITGLKITTEVKGVVQFSVTFQGSGNLSYGTV